MGTIIGSKECVGKSNHEVSRIRAIRGRVDILDEINLLPSPSWQHEEQGYYAEQQQQKPGELQAESAAGRRRM